MIFPPPFPPLSTFPPPHYLVVGKKREVGRSLRRPTFEWGPILAPLLFGGPPLGSTPMGVF